MESKKLYTQLKKVTSLKKSRMEAASWVLEHPEFMPVLIELGQERGHELSVKACWVLDMVARKELRAIFPHLKIFISGIGSVKEQSAIRPISRICEQLLTEFDSRAESTWYKNLEPTELETLTSACFNWLIGKNKVAVRVYAMGSLLILGKTISWIHEELETILQREYVNESAGFRARARMVLSEMNRYHAIKKDQGQANDL